MTSSAKRMANQMNARKSTGPTSATGKAVVAGNATQHGLLSRRLVLADEDPQEFLALVLDLQASLQPRGALEFALVEKIAINMWRQQRLIRAETAAIQLGRSDRKIAAAASRELGREFGDALNEEDLQPFDGEQVTWCRAVIDEAESLEAVDLQTLPARAPLVHTQLQKEAEEDEVDIETYLASVEHGLTGYIGYLVSWCRTELEEAAARPATLAVSELCRDGKVVLPERELELLARYQTTLDNQLFKTLRALREAQQWRLRTIDAAPLDGTGDGYDGSDR